MVGYNENATEHLRSNEIALAGAMAAAVTRGITQPLDVLKIRFQLQVEPIARHPNNKYWGVYHATHTIIKQEGGKALWKGHIPAQALSVTYGMCQVAVFEKLTEKAWFLLPSLQGDTYRPMVHFACACIAGTVGCVVSFPLDTIRTRLVAQGNPKIYNGVIHAFSEIVKTSGVRGLYLGLLPTILQTAPYAGAQFGIYTLLGNFWNYSQDKILGQPGDVNVDESKVKSSSQIASFVIGGIAGMGAKTVVYPMDLAKKRMQMTGFEKAREGFGEAFTCSGFIHCIGKTAQREGLAALFKGFWPSLIKAGVTSSLYFAIYNNTCTFLLQILPRR